MKNLVVLILCVTLLISCKKNDDDNNNQALPPATQTGAGIFACKINGQSFIDTSGGYFNCFYQNVNGEYYFGIQGLDVLQDVTSINFGSENKEIFEGNEYNLFEITENSVWGGIGFSDENNPFEFITTNSNNTGTLTITKLNFTTNIISGTFSFDVINPFTGEITEIREGRFDTLFTQ
ncbi:hypothetical protein [Lacinutrix chionoecetis]